MKQQFSFYSEEKVMVTLPRKWWQWKPTTEIRTVSVRKAAVLPGDFTDFINDPKFREFMLALYPTMHMMQLEDVCDPKEWTRPVDGVRYVGSRRVKNKIFEMDTK